MANLPNDTYLPETLNRSAGKAILIVTAEGTEDIEFFYPYYRFIEAGFKVDVATPDGGAFKGKQGLGLKQTMKIADAIPDDYDMLYIPGGKAPAKLKEAKDAVQLVKGFAASGKPIAAVCHGPQLLAAANVIEGREIAGWPEIEAEVKAAKASYINRETVVDGPFITARWPGDLPAHVKAALAILEKADKTSSITKSAA